ncbi:lasso peptide isopeptide bond-forming cyclase [Rubrobacter taiwanensis]|uniref:asparagine synthase (glutamine-hydrolyzing) n=1 Tax=Rubrobacter taiwanensis TaxID=185139 RepID=A0A4R1BEG9_9ACTN|nr:lasso peptide isopeptide bond-forming cyclase [Rubrobacter taiwanensis]
MSAIAGLVYFDGRPAEHRALKRMLDRVVHRGPDGTGAWSEGGAGLGHRMLFTTPESLNEKLPLVHRSGKLMLTADARIDNREELIVQLGLADRKEVSDSELILAAYEKWGERCPEKLVGDFAFAIWDRSEQKLFCARDHIGVKPFYYYYGSGRAFVFGSEIKSLLCLPEVPKRLNEVRVAENLVPVVEDKTITFYKDILRLPPGHSMTVDRRGASTRRYWALDPYRELRYSSDEEYAEAFREHFTEAVRCRLRSAFPAGSLLSGGLDSSSIVCVARELLAGSGERLHTFSALFDGYNYLPGADESFYRRAVLAGGGTEPHEVRADLIRPLGDIDRILWHEDEPFCNTLHDAYGLYGAARQNGVRVLLDGLDGDAVVGHGLLHLYELARDRRWIKLASEINAVSKRFGRSRRRVLRTRVINPWLAELKYSAPGPLRRAWEALRFRGQSGPALGKIINPGFAREVGLEDRLQGLREETVLYEPARLSRQAQWQGLNTGVYPYTIELLDRIGAAFAVEPRYPFFDRRLMEFCLALPPGQKLKQGWTRAILRHAMAGILPEEVRWRMDKGNLSQPFARTMLLYHRPALEEVIFKDPQVLKPYVNMAALRRTYYRFLAYSTLDDTTAVYIAVVLALWLRRTNLSP